MIRGKKFFELVFIIGMFISCFNSVPANAAITATWQPASTGKIVVDGLTATIIAYSGYEVSDVLVDGVSAGSTARYTFSSDAGHSIHAIFTASSIQVTSAENGIATVLRNADGSRTVTVIPESGYDVESIMLNGEPVTWENVGSLSVFTLSAGITGASIAFNKNIISLYFKDLWLF